MFRVLFWYDSDQFEPKSVREADQAPEPQTPRLDQKPEESNEKESTLLVGDAPCSCKKPENTDIDHSMASEKTIEDNVEMLEEDHKAMRYGIFEFQQKFENLSCIITGLEGIQYENEELKEEVASMRAITSAGEKQRRIIESQLKKDNSDLQRKSDALENENKSLVCKLSLLERAETQVLELNPQAAKPLQGKSDTNSGLKPEVPYAQKKHPMKSKTPPDANYSSSDRAASLHETATKWHSHCQSEEFRLINQNTDLKKKLRTLEEEHDNYVCSKTAELRHLSEDNRSLTVCLDLAVETLSAKLCLLDDLKIELHDLKLKQQEEYTIQQENEDLKELVTSLRQTKLKLNDDKVILKSKLQALYSKNRMILDAKDAAEQSLQQEQALAKQYLAAIDLLKSDLESANKTINENARINDRLQDELSTSKKITTVLDRQNKEIKQNMTRLEESVRKRKSDWRSSEFKLSEERDELKKKLTRLQTENQRLLGKNSLVRIEIESANKKTEDLRVSVAEREQNLIECRKEAEHFRAEIERMAESCKAGSLSTQETQILVEEPPASNQLFMAQKHQPPQEISARLPSRSDSDIELDHQSGEEICRLRAKLCGLETEMKDLKCEMGVKDQEEVESRRLIKELKMQNQLLMEKSEAAIQSAQQAEQAAEEQAAVLAEALAVADAKEVDEKEKDDESGTVELAQLNLDSIEKKKGSKLKQWLKKHVFKGRKLPQESGRNLTPQ